MNIIIAQLGIKREIHGPFAICINQDMLRLLKSTLSEIDEEQWAYGWITVAEKPIVDIPSNCAPSPWKE